MRHRAGSPDVRELLGVVDPAAHRGPGLFVPDSALSALAELIGCDHVTFQVMDVAQRRIQLQCLPSADDEDDDGLDALFWAGFWDSTQCSHPQRTGDYSSVTRLSDFGAEVSFARTTMGAYFASVDVRHELMLPLPPDRELDYRVLLFRSDGPDFTDDDVAILRLLRPHLIALHRRHLRRAEGTPALTPRQRQILGLVADGHSNGEIARALGLSHGTVRKHLENIYANLRVSGRSAAVAAAFTPDYHQPDATGPTIRPISQAG